MLYPDLTQAREFLEDNVEHFPVRRCEYAARFLKELYGFEEVAGFYISENLSSGVIMHAWSYDKNHELYIDITQDQFDGDKIAIMDVYTSKLERVAKLTDYVRSVKTDKFEPDITKLLEKFLF